MKTTKRRNRDRRPSSREEPRPALAALAPEPEPPAEGREPSFLSDLLRRYELHRVARQVEELARALRKRSHEPRVRRILKSVLLGGAALALAAPVVLWASYRYRHVVSRDALVKGHIAEVGIPIDGVVSSVLVDAGDRVRAGQVLARLEDRHLQAELQQARSKLEKATRELEVERLAIENERRRLESWVTEASARSGASRAQVEAAQSRADDAKRQHELQQTLAQKGFIAREQVRETESVQRTALALVAVAEAERKASVAAHHSAEVESEGLAVREERATVLESEIAAFEAEVAVAEAQLEGTLIRAPEDGAVVRRIVEPGGSVVVGQAVFSLWMGEKLWVEAWIDEDDLSQVAVGSPATVTLSAYPDREFSGIVESISVSTDVEMPETEVPQPRRERMRGTPVVGVRIRLDEPGEGLLPGLSGVVAIRKTAR